MKQAMLTEEQEQIAIFKWRDLMLGQYPQLALMCHIPNGGLRSKTEAVRLKRAGIKRGIPDICLFWPSGIYHGLLIELKRIDGGVLSKAQAECLLALNEAGYKAVCCNGAEEAIKVITDYLKGV